MRKERARLTRETSSDSVMRVHHARDSVEPESIEHVLLHVETKVGKQESKDLVMTVVEETAEERNEFVSSNVASTPKTKIMDSRIPKLVSTLSSLVEVLVISSVELVQSEKRSEEEGRRVSSRPPRPSLVQSTHPSRTFLQA